MKPLRVLIVEDSEDDAQLLLRHLKRAEYDVQSVRVQTPTTLKAALTDNEWDIIISDFQMPVLTGLGAHRILKETNLDIPFILVSGTIGEETAVEAMVAGVSDYLMKDNLTRLAPAIERELKEVAQRQARRQAEINSKESEKRLKLALTAAGMGVWEWNLLNDEIYLSPECYEVLKISEFGGNLSAFRKLIHPEDSERVRLKASLAIENHTIYKDEFRVLDSAGDEFWLANRAVTEYTEDGTPYRVIGTVRDITERRRLEQNVRASEARFRTLSENTVAGVTLSEANGNLIYVNDAYLNIVGYSREDFANGLLDCKKLTAPEYRQADEMAIAQARLEGKSEPFEKDYICKDGSRVPVLLAAARSNLDGKEYFVSAILDITERKKAEKEHREAEENFRALVQATTQRVWAAGANGEDEDFLAWWTDLTGQTFEEAKNMGWLNAIHPEDRQSTHQAWLTALENFSLFDVVYRVLIVNGDYHYYAVRGVPVFDEIGSFRQWIGTFTDITERKKAEESLLESENRLQLAITAAKMGIWEWKVTSDTLFWSDMNYLIHGKEVPVANVNDFLNLVHPDDAEKVWADMRRVVEENSVFESEYRIVRPNGEVRSVNTRAIPSYDELGKPDKLFGVTLDFTERKTAQDALIKSEESLRQAQKLESIGRLAGGIAHDFNNMLTVINGYSDMILQQMHQDDPLRRKIQEIKKAGERSSMLTNQLLAFSRRQILQPRVLQINEIISETTSMIQRLIGEDIRLICKLDPDIGQIKADPGQMSQVLMNLTVNSRDAMPEGGTIYIKTENVHFDEDYVNRQIEIKMGDYLLLTVTDTGTGMDKDTLEHIFEPFFTTKEIGVGTGLGLATVYGIVNQSGGQIIVDSKIGQGTTFEIYLPRVEEPVKPFIETFLPEQVLRGTETILLVEDEQIVRRLTREVLESYGYQIIEAVDGEDALQISENNEIDLLLTDIVMPKIGGYELAEKLLETNGQMRVLFTSGYTENSKIQNNLVNSNKNFIHKPFTPEALVYKVRATLDNK